MTHLANVYEEARRTAEPVGSGAAGGPVRFLVVGGRSAVKGVDLAVDAFARRRRPPGEAELVVAGGDFPPRVDGAVRWLGAVPDLAGRMADVGDVLLGVSRTEPYSRAVVEAAFAGLPLLAWTTGGYVEQLDQFGGWGVEPFDVDALAARIDEVTAGSGVRRGEDSRRAAAETPSGHRLVAMDPHRQLIPGPASVHLSRNRRSDRRRRCCIAVNRCVRCLRQRRLVDV